MTRVAFESDMPLAAVEVVSLNSDVLERFVLTGGDSRDVNAPQGAFIRVSLPSGKRLVVRNRDEFGSISSKRKRATSSSRDLAFFNSASEIASRLVVPRESYPALFTPAGPTDSGEDGVTESPRAPVADSRRLPAVPRNAVERMRAYWVRGSDVLEAFSPTPPQGPVTFENGATVSLPGTHAYSLTRRIRTATWKLDGSASEAGTALQIRDEMGVASRVKISASTREVRVRTRKASRTHSPSVAVTLVSAEPRADAILAYLHHGDMQSAKSMAGWTEDAEFMLQEKFNDPYSAAVGAYLLIRTQQPTYISGWLRNLADHFPWLPDGKIIFAWHLIRQREGDHRAEAGHYLLQAAEAGLPYYTIGLRMLLDGLRLLGDPGRVALTRLLATDAVLWDSPVTATLSTDQAGGDLRLASTITVAYKVAA